MLPFQFLYDLYAAWHSQNVPSSKVRGRTTFISDVLSILDDYPDWISPGRYSDGRHIKLSTKCIHGVAEPLIAKYNLQNWYNQNYMQGMDVYKKCTPSNLKSREIGLLRSTCNMADYTNSDNTD